MAFGRKHPPNDCGTPTSTSMRGIQGTRLLANSAIVLGHCVAFEQVPVRKLPGAPKVIDEHIANLGGDEVGDHGCPGPRRNGGLDKRGREGGTRNVGEDYRAGALARKT